jgi:endonuclease/exonuclease/phosphatase (EEP) superfamily protein YafD
MLLMMMMMMMTPSGVQCWNEVAWMTMTKRRRVMHFECAIARLPLMTTTFQQGLMAVAVSEWEVAC